MHHPEQPKTKNRFTNVAAYIAAKYEKQNAPARLSNGIMAVFWQGQWISKEAFERAAIDPESLLIRNNYKGKNPCHKITSNLT